MRIASFGQLVEFLVANKVPHAVNAVAQIVELPSNGAPLPGSLYIRWEKAIPFLQVIHMMIDPVPAERIRELETAIVALNNAIEIPSFGLDGEHRRLYCRWWLSAFPPEGVDPVLINRYGLACIGQAREFLPLFQQVVSGTAGAEIVARARQATAAAAALGGSDA